MTNRLADEPAALCVRKVQFDCSGGSYGPYSLDEQLKRGEGSLETWCGKRVIPSKSSRVFVDLDSCADRFANTPERSLCPECAAAAIAALKAAT